MTKEELKGIIKQLLVTELDLRNKTPDSIADEEPLFGGGLGLDSLDALQLAMAVEERFGVQVPDGEAARGVFASVSALADFVSEASSE